MADIAVIDKPPVALAPEPSARKWVLLPMILRRVLVIIPTLFGIVTLTFIMTHALGGNPARLIAGQASDPATIAAISHKYGFDKPLIEQYWDYISGVFHGSLGTSTVTNAPVLHDLLARFPATLEMVILSIALALLIGIPAGAYAGRTQRRLAQNGIRATTFVVLAIPDFWLSLVALYFFFFKFGWLPSPTGQIGLSGDGPKDITGAALLDSVLTLNGSAFIDAFDHAVLPIGVLGLLLSAPITRLMRAAMLTSMESDFMRFGTSVGLSRIVLWRYAVRNSIPTVITFTGTLFTLLCGGAVLMESVFSWGGAAQYAANAIGRNDFSATQGFVLVCGFLSMIAFLIVDIIQLKLDPRIRTTGRNRALRSILTWRSADAAVSPTPMPIGYTGSELEPSTSELALVDELDEMPSKSRGFAERMAPLTEVGHVVKEIVLDIRPQRAPRAVWRMIRGGNVAMLSGAAIIIAMIAAAWILPLFWKYKVSTPDPLNTLQSPSAVAPLRHRQLRLRPLHPGDLRRAHRPLDRVRRRRHLSRTRHPARAADRLLAAPLRR